MKRITYALMLLAPLVATAAEVYKWTDAQGRVHYGDRPRQQDAEKVEVNAGSGDGGAGAQKEASAIEQLKMRDKKYAGCKEKKEKLETWKAASKIVEQDGLGKERTYTDEEKAQLLAKTQASIDKDCVGV